MKIPNNLSRWQEITKYINWEKFIELCTHSPSVRHNKFCLIRINLKLFYAKPLFDVTFLMSAYQKPVSDILVCKMNILLHVFSMKVETYTIMSLNYFAEAKNVWSGWFWINLLRQNQWHEWWPVWGYVGNELAQSSCSLGLEAFLWSHYLYFCLNTQQEIKTQQWSSYYKNCSLILFLCTLHYIFFLQKKYKNCGFTEIMGAMNQKVASQNQFVNQALWAKSICKMKINSIE